MSSDPLPVAPRPVPPRPEVPAATVDPDPIPAAERAFFLAEFRGVTIVVSVPVLDEEAAAAIARTVRGFAAGDTRFILVVEHHAAAGDLRAALDAVGVGSAVASTPRVWEERSLAELWIAVADHGVLVAVAEPDGVAETAGLLASGVRAAKVVLTDPRGGWGDPPRSFADLRTLHDELARELDGRGDPHLLPAAERALRGGAYSVNLCRAADLERELFTFDGAGTVLTLGGYVRLEDLRVDDLPVVEALVAQGVADGVLKPRTRAEVARMAVGGLGARVARTGHLAGVVGLETEAYGGQGLGEVSGLITVSAFSGAGAGGMLLEGLLERAREAGLRALFAVTVSAPAAEFFARRGYREVPRDAVPDAKWRGYDPGRLAVARCFWRDVEV